MVSLNSTILLGSIGDYLMFIVSGILVVGVTLECTLGRKSHG